MNEYIKLTGSNHVYELISKSSLQDHKVQLVVDDEDNNRFVFTRQSGCYKRVIKPVTETYEDS